MFWHFLVENFSLMLDFWGGGEGRRGCYSRELLGRWMWEDERMYRAGLGGPRRRLEMLGLLERLSSCPGGSSLMYSGF